MMKTKLIHNSLGITQSEFMFLCNEIFTKDEYKSYRENLANAIHPTILKMKLHSTTNDNFPEISYTSQTTGEALGGNETDIHQFYASNVSVYGSATGIYNSSFEIKLYPSQQHPTIRHLVISGDNLKCIEK